MQKRRFKTFLKIILIIALFICINCTNGAGRKSTLIEEIFSDLISAPQKLIVYFKKYVEEDNVYFANVEELKNENDALKLKIQQTEEKLLDYENLKAENDILRKHLNISNLYPDYSVIVADIIMSSNNNWEYTYTINCGSNDGIKPNMAVIAEDGLVGYVETVNENTAKVVSILDAGNSVSARITRTRDTVISKGSLALAKNRQMRVINIPLGVSLVEGDKIETSGLGGIYPKGLLIGKIKSFEQKNNPTENEAIVESLVDFERLETVAVISNILE